MRRFWKTEAKNLEAPRAMILEAGSTIFEIHPLLPPIRLLGLGFTLLIAAWGRSYGVAGALRKGRLRNFPPTPPSFAEDAIDERNRIKKRQKEKRRGFVFNTGAGAEI